MSLSESTVRMGQSSVINYYWKNKTGTAGHILLLGVGEVSCSHMHSQKIVKGFFESHEHILRQITVKTKRVVWRYAVVVCDVRRVCFVCVTITFVT